MNNPNSGSQIPVKGQQPTLLPDSQENANAELQYNDKLVEYRNHLVLAEQKAQEDFDKTVLTLSGGALGISFAFVEKFIKANPIIMTDFLFWSWICWGASIAMVLSSYFFSHLALRRAIIQVDNETINNEHPGAFWDYITAILNVLSGLLFIAGVILIGIFVRNNIRG